MGDEKYLYGSHYSNRGYVIGFLLRKCPLYMLRFSNGKYDKPDRLFQSIMIDWRNCYESQQMYKELIPQFYDDDDSFLINKMKLDLGRRQDGEVVNDVKLPKWAKSASHYLKMNRKALESEYVSENINNWIDLIFGYKQLGHHAEEADNVFYPKCYEQVGVNPYSSI